VDRKKIDTTDPINAAFINNLKKNKKIKSIVKKQVEKKTAEILPLKTRARKTLAQVKQDKEDKEYNKKILELNRRKEYAATITAEKNAQLKTLAVEKMMGQLIPVDLLHRILKINIQSIFVNFENELQNIASIYCDILAGGDRSKLADIITMMRENLERIIKDSKTNSLKEIESTINEYAETRSRGQRK